MTLPAPGHRRGGVSVGKPLRDKSVIALDDLRQSLLQKAFAGELTAQPDQALKEAVA